MLSDAIWRVTQMTIFNRKIQKWHIDITVYFGLLFSGIVFLYYVGNQFVEPIMNLFNKNSGAAASVLILTAGFTIYAYCICTDKLQSIIFMFCAGMSFLALLLNHNVFSIWLMIFLFFMIPILFRPTAELIKRDMQLFFLYAFMLCNMSLFTNYTAVFQKEVSYSLEQSVYMEMLLAVGGLIFFHYWDRLPEGADLTKISMVKLRRRFMTAVMFLAAAFITIICTGSKWQELSDEGVQAFVKNASLSLVNEFAAENSLFFISIQKFGVVITGIILLAVYQMMRKILKNYHPDKRGTNFLILLAIVFLIECLAWEIPLAVVVVYLAVLVLAAFIKEEKREIIISYGSVKNEDEEKQIIMDEFDSIVAIAGDDTVGTCR